MLHETVPTEGVVEWVAVAVSVGAMIVATAVLSRSAARHDAIHEHELAGRARRARVARIERLARIRLHIRPVWLVGVRDLQFRRRRFLIAVARHLGRLRHDPDHVGHEQRPRRRDRPDRRLVPRRLLGGGRGASGPFTATKFVVDRRRRAGAERRRACEAASPMIAARATIGTDSLTDVNLLGYVPGGVGAPDGHRGASRRSAGARSSSTTSSTPTSASGRDQRQARTRRRQGRRPPVQLRRPHGLHDRSRTRRTSRSPGNRSPAR